MSAANHLISERISPDFFTVLELSQSISDLTNGRFDITVGPLVDLWGFGAGSNGSQKKPDQNLLNTILSNVGWENLILDKESFSIKKIKPISIDLSAIAKGFGADKVAELLSAKDKLLRGFSIEGKFIEEEMFNKALDNFLNELDDILKN